MSTEYLVLYILQGKHLKGLYKVSEGIKRLVVPVQFVGLEKLHAENLLASGPYVEESHHVENVWLKVDHPRDCK
jgi:hypothetical protein